jgi:hypothetical protein
MCLSRIGDLWAGGGRLFGSNNGSGVRVSRADDELRIGLGLDFNPSQRIGRDVRSRLGQEVVFLDWVLKFL